MTWTREAVEMMVALGGVESVAFDDDRIPQVTWETGGPGLWLGLLGYREPTDGLWRWSVEARTSEASLSKLFRETTGDRERCSRPSSISSTSTKESPRASPRTRCPPICPPLPATG